MVFFYFLHHLQTLHTCPLDSSIFSCSLLRRTSTVEKLDSNFPPTRRKNSNAVKCMKFLTYLRYIPVQKSHLHMLMCIKCHYSKKKFKYNPHDTGPLLYLDTHWGLHTFGCHCSIYTFSFGLFFSWGRAFLRCWRDWGLLLGFGTSCLSISAFFLVMLLLALFLLTGRTSVTFPLKMNYTQKKTHTHNNYIPPGLFRPFIR